MKITNITKGGKGLNTADGSKVFVNPGETVDAELTPAELKTLSKEWWKVGGKPAPVAEPKNKDEGGGEGGEGGEGATYKAVHRGAGSFSIMDGEDVEVIEKITKKEAEAFNALDDEAKIEYVLEHAKK